MCGRYTHLFTWRQLHRLMGLTTPEVQLPLRYNVAPTQLAPVVVQAGEERRLEMLRWGLVPFWAKDASIGAKTVNARSETAAGAPAFRAAMMHRRCIVPASGFYEWQALGGKRPKQPWYFSRTDGEPMLLAGLWESWRPSGDEQAQPVRTFTILTTEASGVVVPVHGRMPVILEPDRVGSWLGPEMLEAAARTVLLRQADAQVLKAQQVSTWVNSPGHEDQRCLEAPTEEPGGLWGGGLSDKPAE